MPISIYTEDQVFAIAVAFFAAKPKLRGAPFTEMSFLGGQARSLAQVISSVLQSVQDADYDSLPQVIYQSGVATTPTSTAALDNWAVALGLPSNLGAGVYGRNGKAAAVATGSNATATGTPGITVSTGTTLIDVATGQVTLKLRAGFTMPGGGSQAVTIDSVTTGLVGNLQAGAVLRWVSPPGGLASTITLTAVSGGPPLLGGSDSESDVALALRILARLQNPPKGGTASDWRYWTQSATDSNGVSLNILRAYVFPLRDATGSVTIVPLLAGSGTGRIPSNTVIGQVLTFLNSLRIVTDTAYVKAATYTSNLSIVVRIRPATGYANDWDDAGISASVVSVTTNQIVISSLTPTALNAAVTAGNSARVQLQISGTPLPFVANVTAFQDNYPIGGQATLTLSAAPAGTPTLMYAAGSATLPIATAVLSYVDNLGPSTASGFADPNDSWEDTVSVGRIAQTALDTVGADGRRCLIYAPNVGNDPSQSIGVSIAVGVGTPAALDIPTLDNVPGSGPQIAVCGSVLVLKG